MVEGGLTVILQKRSIDDLYRILQDEQVLNLLVMEGNYIARRITINNDGSVIFGRYKSSFLNWLFREEKVLSFMDLSMNLMHILSGNADVSVSEEAKMNRNASMFIDWYNAAIHRKDWDEAVRLLMYCYYLGFRNPPELKEEKQQHKQQQQQQQQARPQGGHKHTQTTVYRTRTLLRSGGTLISALFDENGVFCGFER